MTQTYLREPRGPDYYWYEVKVETGANKLQIGATVITIPPGLYFQGVSADTAFPGLWSTIEALAPVGTTLHACTPVKSSSQVGCGLEIRSGSSLTVDIDITDGIPAALIGWSPGTTDKTGTSIKSDQTLNGVWRSRQIGNGVASVKAQRPTQVAFDSHPSPRKRITPWEFNDVVTLEYPYVPALFTISQRAELVSYYLGHGVDPADIYAAFEQLWRAFTRGRRVLIYGDATAPPANLYGLTCLKWGEDGVEDISTVTRRENLTQEHYEISFEPYLMTESPVEPS